MFEAALFKKGAQKSREKSTNSKRTVMFKSHIINCMNEKGGMVCIGLQQKSAAIS